MVKWFSNPASCVPLTISTFGVEPTPCGVPINSLFLNDSALYADNSSAYLFR